MINNSPKEGEIIELGIYHAKDDKDYDCHFIPDEQIANAVGPLPHDIGTRGVAFTVHATSKEEAKKKLAQAIGPGIWV